MGRALGWWPVTLWIAASAFALQQPDAKQPRAQAPALSPDVQADKRVTFRLRAPNASSVELHGEWTAGTIAMTKDGNGIWSATVGPLPSEVYAYSFTVDGVGIADPQNSMVKLAARGAAQSLVAIVPAFRRVCTMRADVPHGTVQENWYYSAKALNHELRQCFVYTPPGYDSALGVRVSGIGLAARRRKLRNQLAIHRPRKFHRR